MVKERVESHGILSIDKLQKGLLEGRVTPSLASDFSGHEGAHAREDELGYGEFGFVIEWDNGRGYIMAYYRPIGERTPEQMMRIASAPGFTEMSEWDLFLYKIYEAQFFKDEKYKNYEEEEIAKKDFKEQELQEVEIQSVVEQLIERLDYPYQVKRPDDWHKDAGNDFTKALKDTYREKVDKLMGEGKLPGLDEVGSVDQDELSLKYGPVLRQAFEEACQEVGLEFAEIESEDEGLDYEHEYDQFEGSYGDVYKAVD